ncbi:condensation domain-containing protein [Aquabacterium sp. A7-Y]|uniref:condensation domain-containing protein n=1 Tax=Aquabacterium sp. A7-Y TaxID=1349605 RepID=UPI00223DD913|nr:condensation domain-containing protein [Aquabacterium sp. A7-Y]MCW7538520.1 condensation domain-containing protein [Aquabacterium sp. A7-Y]
MLTIPRLLSNLQARGITLSLSKGELAYRAPKGALTPLDRDQLATRRAELIAYLAAQSARLRGPITLPRSAPVQPSLLQELWWTWYGRPPRQLNQERLPLIKMYRGISVARLKETIHQLLVRHDTLRSSFREEDGQLRIALNAPEAFVVDVEELGAVVPPAGLEDELKARATAYSEQQLPLDGPWLLRAKVFVISPNDVLLVFVFHHIIVDAASLLLILADLEALLSNDATPASLPAALQFTDYAAWERAWMDSPERQPLIDYWARWLRSQSALVAPLSRKTLEWRPGLKIDRRFSFTSRVLGKINAYAVSQHTSLFNVLLTAFGLALARWSGVDRFPIRCVGDLRTSPELARIVGYMVCSDAVEISAPRDGDFVEMLKANEIEYHSALTLRVPTLLRHPLRAGGQGIEDPRHIAATINMFSVRLPAASGAPDPAPEARGDDPWPPPVTRGPGEPWPILLPSIYLRLIDYGDSLQGSLELNDELLQAAEQDALLDTFFSVISERLLR